MARWVKLAAVLVVGACLAAACFGIAVVPTPSMEHTVLVGDHLLVWKLYRTPKRGDIISFRAPGHGRYIFLKRVVAAPGDRVEIRDGVLFVNGVAERNRFAESRSPRLRTLPAFVLADGRFFVMGDNRDLSEDSRDYGPINAADIVGTPIAVLWSVRAQTADLIDNRGDLSTLFYMRTFRHVIASTRWSRTGLLL